jgi:uncharacterized membrane protein (Fun14 family)
VLTWGRLRKRTKALLMVALPLLSISLATYANCYFALDRGIDALVTGLILLLGFGGFLSFVIGIVLRKIEFCIWAIYIGVGLCLQISLSGKFLIPVHKSQYSETIKSGGIIISAIERYRQDNQQFPISLEDLIPKYLQQLPHTKYQLFFKEESFRLIPDSFSIQNFPHLRFTKDGFLLCEYSFDKKSWYCD